MGLKLEDYDNKIDGFDVYFHTFWRNLPPTFVADWLWQFRPRVTKSNRISL